MDHMRASTLITLRCLHQFETELRFRDLIMMEVQLSIENAFLQRQAKYTGVEYLDYFLGLEQLGS